jgi:excisionase family DNA binding protein
MTEEELHDMPTLLKVTEMADILRIGRNAAYEIIYQDDFPILRLGPKKIRVPKQELLDWIKSNIKKYRIS